MNRLVLWILFSFFLLLFPVDIQANNNEQQKEHQYLLAMDALDSRYHRSRVRALRMLQDLIPTHRDRLLEDMRTHDSERVRFALAKMFASSGETEAVGPIVYNTIKANPATRIQWVDLLKGYRFFAYWYVDTLQQIQRPELREEDYSLDLAVLRNELLDAAVLRFYNTHPKKLFPSSVSNLWRYGEREVIERLKLILTDDNYPLLSALAENNRSRNTEVRARAIFLLGRSHRSQLVKNFLLGIYNEEVFAKDIYEEVPIGPWGATPVNRSPIWNLDDEAAIALWRSSNIKDFAQELINKSLSRAGSYKARNLDPYVGYCAKEILHICYEANKIDSFVKYYREFSGFIEEKIAPKKSRIFTSLKLYIAQCHYWAACMFAPEERLEESFAAIQEAIEWGFDDWDLLCGDEELSNLYNYEPFKLWIQEKRRHPALRDQIPPSVGFVCPFQ